MDASDLQAKYERAKTLLNGGQKQLADAHRHLREILPNVRQVRARGAINERIWSCERALGQRTSYFSQAGQDAYLDERIFKGKREGVFVEIGGYDGVTGSNCLFFEMMRGWSGIVIEPSPTFFERAASTRKATCLQVALADQEGEAEFLEVQEGFSQMSGLTASYDEGLRNQVESDPRHKGELIKVKTQTLEQILDHAEFSQIDYISLDVEGGEMSVLSSFPFDKYDIRAWTIENNTSDTEVPELMMSKGYQRVEAIGVDDVYVGGRTA
ncbi:MAG: FkbM family methyltransferase [Pseudomonadota bacterium]